MGDLIRDALKDARIIPAEQTIKAKDFNNGKIALQNVIKHMQAIGINLWREKDGIIPLVTSREKYTLGPNGDEIANADDFFTTFLSADQVITDTLMNVVSTTGMVGAPDILGFNPATSTQDWTALNSATLAIVSSELKVTNVGGVAGGAEYDLDTVTGTTYQVDFSYTKGTSVSALFTVSDPSGDLDTVTLTATGTSKLEFTARDITTTFSIESTSIVIGETSLLGSLNYRDKTAGSRIGIAMDDGTRYWDDVVTVDSSLTATINNGLPSGTTSALSVYSFTELIPRPMRILQATFASTLTASEIPVNQWSGEEYFDQPDKASSGTIVNWYYSPKLTDGELFVWQVASNINQVLRFKYVRPFDVPESIDDPLDIPSEWYLPVKWAVASEVGPQYGVPQDRQLINEQKALTTKQEVLDFDVERDSMSLQPDFN